MFVFTVYATHFQYNYIRYDKGVLLNRTTVYSLENLEYRLKINGLSSFNPSQR